MASSASGRSRVRVSKNRKKAWRKHCDINDVEKFLEEKRFEERIGGPISEKPDHEIFFHHTTKDPVQYRKTKLKELGNLKCHQSLCAYSKVEPPVNPQQVIGKKQRKKISAVQNKKLKGILQHVNRPEKAAPSSERFHDLWSEDADAEKPDPEIKELIDYRDEITRKKPVKVPSHLYQKPSLLPAVEVPHPGASYNPLYEDHQDLLRKAVVIEEKKFKEELHLKRVLTDMFPVKSEAPTEQTWVAEMSQGLFDGENDAEVEEDGSTLLLCKERVTTEGQKSKSQKRKEKERKQMERQRILEKQTKHEMNQVFRLRSIMSTIKQKEKLSEKRQLQKEQRHIEKLYQPRTISRYKYEPNDLEVNLSEELQGSLRELKVEGNIFEDRYKSLQRRNIIEPRIRQKRKRKYKLKVQVKRSHRDFQ